MFVNGPHLVTEHLVSSNMIVQMPCNFVLSFCTDWFSPSPTGKMAYCKACKTELTLLAPSASGRILLRDSVVRGPHLHSSQESQSRRITFGCSPCHPGSFLTADYPTPLVKDCFKESAITASISMGQMKCTALVTQVLGPTFKEVAKRAVFSDS